MRKGDIDDEALQASLVENEQELTQPVRIQRPVSVHELWTGEQVRPDPYTVEAEAPNQVQVGHQMRGAHRRKVRNERKKLGRAVDGEPIALYRELLCMSLVRRETEGNQNDKTSRETPEHPSRHVHVCLLP